MKRLIRSGHLLAAATIATLAAWPLAQIAAAGPLKPVVPTALQVPVGNKVLLVGHAVGVQIYVCSTTAGANHWDFVEPQADLYTSSGKLLAKHFAGPTWQANDGSAVVGRVVARVTVDTTAIPWLLLAAASTAVGTDGDRLVDTTYIQRIATSGGLAPAAADCNASRAGTSVGVPYTADYYFWKAQEEIRDEL